jgi:hypothetical protein
MPKNEKGTPKEIANRCKSKGLQKLKWQVCFCSQVMFSQKAISGFVKCVRSNAVIKMALNAI